MKRTSMAALLAALLIGGCGDKTPTSGPATTASPTPAAKPADATTPALPAELRTDAYRYYGLAQAEPVEMEVRVPGVPAFRGTQSARFVGMEGDAAKFEIIRTGQYGQTFGNETVLLTPEGVKIASITKGEILDGGLEMPSNLEKGTKWTVKHTLKVKQSETSQPETVRDESVYTVVGPERVKTAVGEYDALLVTSMGTQERAGEKLNVQTKAWYVENRGPVKLEITTEQGGGPPLVMVIEEAA